jgi:hypothetical protein
VLPFILPPFGEAGRNLGVSWKQAGNRVRNRCRTPRFGRYLPVLQCVTRKCVKFDPVSDQARSRSHNILGDRPAVRGRPNDTSYPQETKGIVAAVLTADPLAGRAAMGNIHGRTGCFRRLAPHRAIPCIPVSDNGISAADALILQALRWHGVEPEILLHQVVKPKLDHEKVRARRPCEKRAFRFARDRRYSGRTTESGAQKSRTLENPFRPL